MHIYVYTYIHTYIHIYQLSLAAATAWQEKFAKNLRNLHASNMSDTHAITQARLALDVLVFH